MNFRNLAALLLIVSMGAVANAKSVKQKANFSNKVLRDDVVAQADNMTDDASSVQQLVTTVAETSPEVVPVTIDPVIDPVIVGGPGSCYHEPEQMVLKLSTPFSRIVQSLKDIVAGADYTWTVADLVIDLSYIQPTDQSYNLASRIVNYIINKIEVNGRIALNAAISASNADIEAQNLITQAANHAVAEQNAIVEAQNVITQALNDQAIAADSELSLILQDITDYIATIEVNFDSVLPPIVMPEQVAPSVSLPALVAIEPIALLQNDTPEYIDQVATQKAAAATLRDSLIDLHNFLFLPPVVTQATE